MLILTDSDSFWLDLDQLCQGVLQTAGDGNGGSLSNVEIRELLCAQLGSGVNGSARFAYNIIFSAGVGLLQYLDDELLALTGSGTVTDGDDFYLIFSKKLFDDDLSLVILSVGFDGGVND